MDTEPTTTIPRKKAGLFEVSLLACSLLACVGFWAIYALRADAFATVTVCPPWIWCAFGLAAAVMMSMRRQGRRLARLSLLAWAAYWLTTADTPSATLRTASRQLFGRPDAGAFQGTPIRVVSLNCGSFGKRSARDVLKVNPQIVLLQESPGREEIEALTRQLFGHRGGYLWSSDASIVADGLVTPSPINSELGGRAVCARVQLPSGHLINVVSLRMEPPIVRIDFWSADCWRSQTQNRRLRRQQLARIVERTAELPRGTPLILGGDFNAPAGDAIFRKLKPRLRDAFADAGVGWGNTVINEAPFARIDQIWIDEHAQAVEVRAVRTLGSDHRMVVADLILQTPDRHERQEEDGAGSAPQLTVYAGE